MCLVSTYQIWKKGSGDDFFQSKMYLMNFVKSEKMIRLAFASLRNESLHEFSNNVAFSQL